jgi:hypothetical protein
MTVDLKEDEIGLEIDRVNAGVGPASIDPLHVLPLAEAFFELVGALVEVEELDASLRGLAVVDKCLAVTTSVDPPDLAAYIVGRAHELILGPRPANRRLQGRVTAVKTAIAKLPAGYVAASVSKGSRKTFEMADVKPGAPWATVVLRAVPVRVGGSSPTSRFSAGGEPRPFTLALADRAQARELGRFLYQEIEIQAEVLRSSSGAIEQGSLLDFSPLEAGDPIAHWREFLKEGAKDLEGVVDLEEELRRGDD